MSQISSSWARQRSALRRWLTGVLLGLAGLLLTLAATAADKADQAAERSGAADLIAAGQHAYRLGKYGFAIQALEQALRIEVRPELWLDAADAYRQRFVAAGAAYDRLKALGYYEAYLEARPAGPRSRRVREQLAQLEARQPAGEPAAQPPPPGAAAQTRLAVLCTALGATARIDRGKARKLPLFLTVKPGRHTLVIGAEGYEEQRREIAVDAGFVYAVRADLAPLAAKLSVDATSGAEVHLDGRLLGTTPFEQPIEVEPGTALLSVTANGYHPHSEQVTLQRGQDHELKIRLAMTRQRMGGLFLAASGGAAVVAGIAFGVASFVAEPKRNEDPEPAEEAARWAQSADFRVVSGMTAGVGFGLSVFGGVLLIFDEPVLSFTPRAGPEQAGATVTVAF